MCYSHTHARTHTHTRNPHPAHGYLGSFNAVQYHLQHSVTAGRVGTDSEVAPVGSCCNALLRKHLLVQVVRQLLTEVWEEEGRIQQSAAACNSNIQHLTVCSHTQHNTTTYIQIHSLPPPTHPLQGFDHLIHLSCKSNTVGMCHWTVSLITGWYDGADSKNNVAPPC